MIFQIYVTPKSWIKLILLTMMYTSSSCLENIYSQQFTKSGSISNTTCDPNEDCKDNGQIGHLVPDPVDCHKYYVCVLINNELMASDGSLTCPEGQYFNPTISSCEDEIQPCNNICEKLCYPSCNVDIDYLAYPGNCSLYYHCSTGITEQCPPDNPYFNGIACTTNSIACCNFCAPNYCIKIGVQIPDLCDCRKYYICTEIGVPSEDVHLSCPDGEIFDPVSGGCSAGETCKPLCSSGTCSSSPYSTQPTTTSTPVFTNSRTYKSSSTNRFTFAPTLTSTSKPCLMSLLCTSVGNFSRCPYCDETYFVCPAIGDYASIANCPTDSLYNTNPSYPFCVYYVNCPYYP